MRRKSESTSAAKREAHDRADAAMPERRGPDGEAGRDGARRGANRERERREYERRKAKGKPLSKITQDAIRYEKCFESGVVKVEKRALLDNMRRGQHGLPQPRREREGGAVRPAPAGLQPVRADDAPAVVGHRARRRPPVDPRRGAHIPPAGRARPPARRGQRGAHRPRVEGQDGHRDAPAAHDLHQGRQRGRGPEHPRRPGQGHTPRLRVDGIRPDGAERRGMASR